MKKVMNKFNMALIGMMIAGNAFAAQVNASAVCELVSDLHSVFKLLQMLAFIGAGFMIAGWAWGYISSGKAEIKDIKEKGTGLLVGFILLLGVAFLLRFVTSAAGLQTLGCVEGLFAR